MIRIISGKIRAGKTLLAVHFMNLDTCVNGYENYLKSCHEIDNLRKNGFDFSYPIQKHVTYFNGQATFKSYCRPVKTAYIFNPWEMGLPVAGKKTRLFIPYSKIYIDEAQRFYNSRLSYCFPDFVSRFYELCGHWGLDITLIAQRAGLIDVNIREIATEFIHVEKLEKEEDSLGNLVKATWYVRKFTNYSDLEHYLNGHKELGEEEIITSEENLYKFYDTHFYKFLFLNEMKSRDFLQQVLKPFIYSPDICNKLSEVYSATAPSNYYDKKGD